MKKKGFFVRLAILVNWCFAILLALSLMVPYVPPSSFYNISLVSLFVAPLMVVNGLFLIYWIFRSAKHSLISLVVLIFAVLQFGMLFGMGPDKKAAVFKDSFTLISYNVRLFNAYEPKPDTAEVQRVMDAIIMRQPEVLCLQEYYREHGDFDSYPYHFEHFKGQNKLGHAIFSKFPIVSSGVFDFPDTGNNVIYTDLDIEGQRVRVYNLHLQSMGISANINYLQQSNSDVLRHQLAQAFIKQQRQLEQVLKHADSSPYPVVLAGDFNNTPFSYIYHKTAVNFKDAFKQAGTGLGITFWFEFVPMRIDYIFTSTFFQVIEFHTIEESFSDHFPIEARLGWQ